MQVVCQYEWLFFYMFVSIWFLVWWTDYGFTYPYTRTYTNSEIHTVTVNQTLKKPHLLVRISKILIRSLSHPFTGKDKNSRLEEQHTCYCVLEEHGIESKRIEWGDLTAGKEKKTKKKLKATKCHTRRCPYKTENFLFQQSSKLKPHSYSYHTKMDLYVIYLFFFCLSDLLKRTFFVKVVLLLLLLLLMRLQLLFLLGHMANY